MSYKKFLLLGVGLIFFQACQQSSDNSEKEIKADVPTRLPMKQFSFEDSLDFKQPNSDWKIVGNVLASPFGEKTSIEEGKGILVIDAEQSTEKMPLITQFDHNDLEIDLEFLLTSDTEAEIIFQGRYAMSLADSWGKNEGKQLIGSIIGQDNASSKIPEANTCMAPGLWQNLKVFFRAAKFDDQGKKIESAKFESVSLNGLVIFQDLAIESPSAEAPFQEESLTGPLVLSVNKGTFALRNFQYKTYNQDSLALKNIAYSYYVVGAQTLPNFDTLQVTKTGMALDLDVNSVATRGDSFAIVYNATLAVPTAGQYLFYTMMDDGGELYIDSTLVTRSGKVDGEVYDRVIMDLEKGDHHVKIKYFQRGWRASINWFYEGPEISYKRFGTGNRPPGFRNRNTERIVVDPGVEPEMIRSFIIYGDTMRKTHVISVGSPKGVHYTFDMNDAAIIKAWKGKFADTDDMWHERGEPQLLRPRNFAIEPKDGLPIALLNSADASWESNKENYKFKRYKLSTDGYPIFEYTFKNLEFSDDVRPSEDGQGLVRTVSIAGKPEGKAFFKIAEGGPISQISEGLYNIGGMYFIRTEKNAGLQVRDNKEIIVALSPDSDKSSIKYTIIW